MRRSSARGGHVLRLFGFPRASRPGLPRVCANLDRSLIGPLKGVTYKGSATATGKLSRILRNVMTIPALINTRVLLHQSGCNQRAILWAWKALAILAMAWGVAETSLAQSTATTVITGAHGAGPARCVRVPGCD
jgi:hypothetical protein